ncbi:MAG: hypothetical protein ACJ8H8_22440 [Geminicoccaceae bacterium]
MSRGFELAGRRFTIPAPVVGVAETDGREVAGLVPAVQARVGDDLIAYHLTADAVDLDIAASGRAPVLLEHARTLDAIIGALSSAWLDGPLLVFTARLAPVPEAARLWRLLAGGFAVSISLGAEIEAAEVAGMTPWGGQRIEVQRRRLTEVSAVAFGRTPGAYMAPLASAKGRELAATCRRAAEAIRHRLRLNHWTSDWPHEAGRRLAGQLGTGPAETGRLLAVEAASRADQLVADLAGKAVGR